MHSVQRFVICTALHYLGALCSWATAMPTSPIDGSVLTIKEVAAFLKVNDRTVYRLAADSGSVCGHEWLHETGSCGVGWLA